MQSLKQDLKDGASVTSAIYNAGFGSSSGVYQRTDSRLGMMPRQYRAGGQGVEISYAIVPTPLGMMMLAATDRGLCSLAFGATHEELRLSLEREFPASARRAMSEPVSAQFSAWMEALRGYLEGARTLDPIPLALNGTAFQYKVWSYLQTIPAGSVQTYTEVADAIGHPTAVRAVASACAANRVALAVPCHRVIRGNGGLGGYRWGLERKRALLELERSQKATRTERAQSIVANTSAK